MSRISLRNSCPSSNSKVTSCPQIKKIGSMRKQTCLVISCLATLIVLFGQRMSNVLTQLRDSETLVQRCRDNLVGQIVGKLTTETRPEKSGTFNLSQVLQTLPSAPLLLPNMVGGRSFIMFKRSSYTIVRHHRPAWQALCTKQSTF